MGVSSSFPSKSKFQVLLGHSVQEVFYSTALILTHVNSKMISKIIARSKRFVELSFSDIDSLAVAMLKK